MALAIDGGSAATSAATPPYPPAGVEAAEAAEAAEAPGSLAARRASRRPSALRRRLITIPGVVILFAIVIPSLPILFVVATCIDAVRAVIAKTPAVAIRLVALLACYLTAEVVGLLALFFVWIASGFGASRARLVDLTYRVQGLWVGFLFAVAKGIFRLRFEVDGDESVTPGPILVFIRHASIADVLLPSVFITNRHGVRLRFVLKRELLSGPCFDVAGNRIPNHFVGRDSKETAIEVEAVRELTRDLGSAEGVLIYPEGTRFTERKRASLLERMAQSGGAALARVERFRHVLPPRQGGPLALLDGFTPADIVFVAHRGFEGIATINDVWNGRAVGRVMRVKMWRVSRSSIPSSREERAAWLDDQWSAVDAWVGDSAR